MAAQFEDVLARARRIAATPVLEAAADWKQARPDGRVSTIQVNSGIAPLIKSSVQAYLLVTVLGVEVVASRPVLGFFRPYLSLGQCAHFLDKVRVQHLLALSSFGVGKVTDIGETFSGLLASASKPPLTRFSDGFLTGLFDRITTEIQRGWNYQHLAPNAGAVADPQLDKSMKVSL